jgi:hypothetical protein
MKEEGAGKQLILHRVHTTNDCFGRCPSVRSSLFILLSFFSRAPPLLLPRKRLQQRTYRLASFLFYHRQ